jgi:hypothetical protein
MNKNTILLAGLCILSTVNIFSFNEEQRDILYALHLLNQDYASVSMIAENIDMFIGIIQMNVQMNQKKFEHATSKRNMTFAGTAVAIGTSSVAALVVTETIECCLKKMASEGLSHSQFRWLRSVFNVPLTVIPTLIRMYSAYAIYDTVKAKNRLEESIALDQEILAKLEELKYSLPQAAQEEASGKDLLKKLA